ncbi:MAG: acyltransferase family protein [Gemmatimonadota bacterium]
MTHRPDIDGLRAIAVVPVVLFHARVGPFSGGFVGVDVFFVISGYLITTLLLADIRSGRFSLASFYERRARRILPALFGVLLGSSVVVHALFLPDDAKAHGASLLATLLFSSNILFARQTGYFDQPAEAKPLLHTWSLSVEEQFYIVYPLFLFLVGRYLRGRYAAAIGAAFLLSLAWSLWAVTASPATTFFLAPGRVWELLAGALLALGIIPPVRGFVLPNLLGIVGLAAIGYGVLAFSAATPFPGPNALIPVLGTVLVLHGGAARDSLVSRVLSIGPLVFVGLISYSLYLWHWVLIVFIRYYLIRPLTSVEIGMTIAASCGVAMLSWRFVERPFRGAAGWGSRKRLVIAAATMAVGLGFYASAALATGGFPNRFPGDALRLLGSKDDVWARRSECIDKTCRIGAPGAAESFMLWGDSHAAALAPAVERVAIAKQMAGLVATSNACAPLLRSQRYVQGHEDCGAFNDSILALIEKRRIRTVLLHARWAFYAEGERYKVEEGIAGLLPLSKRVADNIEAFEPLLRATLAELLRRQIVVVVIASVPEVGVRVPTVLARKAISGSTVDLGLPYSTFLVRQTRAYDALRRVGHEYGVRVVFPHEVLCNAFTCGLEKDGDPLYVDANHLSVTGARYLEPMLAGILSPD